MKKRKYQLEDDNKLILRLLSKEQGGNVNYAVQTGLFAGIIFHKGYLFNITTSYGDVLLSRMLNFVNDIYVDTKDKTARPSENRNEFQIIIAYLFIQSFEKDKETVKLQSGDTISFDEQVYTIETVGSLANENLNTIGHITLSFSEVPEDDRIESGIYLSPHELPEVSVGTKRSYNH